MSWAPFFSEKADLARMIFEAYAPPASRNPHPGFVGPFQPGTVYPLNAENRRLLLQRQPDLLPSLNSLDPIPKPAPEYNFSFQEPGTLTTPEGFQLPVTELAFFKTHEGQTPFTSRASTSTSGGSAGGPSGPPRIRGVQMSLLFIGGTLLLYAGMDKWGVPEKVQGPLTLAALVGGPTLMQGGLSLFGRAEPLSWKGLGANVNGLATSWSYFAPYQMGAAIFLHETGLAASGTRENTIGSLLLGASPFLASKWIPALRPFVAASPVIAGSAEATVATCSLGAVSRSLSRVIPGIGQALIVDTCLGWGMDIGEYLTGQDEDPYHKLYKFTRDLLMAKDFGKYPMYLAGNVMRLSADVGDTLAQVEDHLKGEDRPGLLQRQIADFIQSSNDWGKAMRSILITLAFEGAQDGKFDMEYLEKGVRELYQGRSAKDIENAYFLLTLTGYSAKEAQRIKDLIASEGSFDRKRMELFLKEAIQDELKNNFTDFMDARLLQFARQSYREDGKGRRIDWVAFEKKVADFYSDNQRAMTEAYSSKNKTDFKGTGLRRLISQQGALTNIPELERLLVNLIKNQETNPKSRR